MHPLIVRDVHNLSVRHRIEALETAMFEAVAAGTVEHTLHDAASDEGNDEADHYFGDRVYARGLWIPEGNLVVGRVHLQARVCIVAAGECTWVDEHNPDPQRVSAPWVGEFERGSKTAVLAHSDCYWLAVLGTDLKDPQEIAHTLTVQNTQQYVRTLERRETLP